MASVSSFIHASSLAVRTAAQERTDSAISSTTLVPASEMFGATLPVSSAHTASMSCWFVGFEITPHLR